MNSMSRHLRLILCIAFLVLFSTVNLAHAHESRPASLKIVERGANTYEVSWKRPALKDAVLRISPLFPKDCEEISRRSTRLSGALITRGVIRCSKSLSGRRISIEGLSATQVDVLVRAKLSENRERSWLLRGGHDSFELSRELRPAEVVRSYVSLGVEHILSGIDHLLFVLGLVLLISSRRALVLAVTTFTIAHSISLAAASLKLIVVPQAPVEAVIALSIVLLAVENIRKMEGQEAWSARRPWLVAFVVGLLHGLGFAGALREVGLPENEIPLALVSFNAGVEFGQLLFVGATFALWWVLKRVSVKLPASSKRMFTYGMGSLAAFWVAERTAAFL